jgi:hypothetical protein
MTARVFISYSHADEALVEKLHKHIAQLRRDGSVSDWYDRQIKVSDRINGSIIDELDSADIFLACVSPDWIASRYAFEEEFNRALEREKAGQIVIAPVILRPCEWQATELKKFLALPKDGKAVTEYVNQDVAFLEVATGIRDWTKRGTLGLLSEGRSSAPSRPQVSAANETRYRAKRQFDKIDKMDFINLAFEEIYRFFEASSAEIRAIPNIECRLSNLSESYFYCTVINRGSARGFETLHVRKGGSFSAIDILFGEKNATGTSNGGFSVTADDYQLFLSEMMLGSYGDKGNLTAIDAAKMLWNDLLSKVGIDYA